MSAIKRFHFSRMAYLLDTEHMCTLYQANCGGNFKLTVFEISNPRGLLQSGKCCDWGGNWRCSGTCDTWMKMCIANSITNTSFSRCYHLPGRKWSFQSQVYLKSNNIKNPKGTNTENGQYTNPVILPFEKLKVREFEFVETILHCMT